MGQFVRELSEPNRNQEIIARQQSFSVDWTGSIEFQAELIDRNEMSLSIPGILPQVYPNNYINGSNIRENA
jgi:hypothetical protein